MDVWIESRHARAMICGRNTVKTWMFWLIAVVWIATAAPILILSLFLLEVPLWPSFTEESTVEGVSIFAVFAAWFYLTPVVLIVVGRRRRRTPA